MTTTPFNPSSSSGPVSPRLEVGHRSFRTAVEAESFVRRLLERDGVLTGRVETDHRGLAVVLTVEHDYLYGASYGQNPPVELVYRPALG
jgi:hypothetical protein